MTLPFLFANVSGNTLGANLDADLAQLGLGVTYPCTAVGTNTIALTPASGWPTINTYTNNLTFIFNAAANSTGAVTVNVSSVGALNLYLPDGVTQAASGSLISGKTYVIIYVSTLNASAGGFQIIAPSTTGLTVIRSYIAGLTLSNDGGSPNNVIDVAAGTCADSTNAAMINLGAFTKSTNSSWVAGTSSPGMGQGLTIANSTWYHVFAIINGAAADVYFDTSVTAANKPAGTTAFRRIGSFLTDASAHIVAFSQNGDEFIWSNGPFIDINTVSLGTSSTLFAMSVPPGVKTNIIITANATNAGAWVVYLQPADMATQATGSALESLTAAAGVTNAGQFTIRTNTSQQIRAVASAASTTLQTGTVGYVDSRGKFN